MPSLLDTVLGLGAIAAPIAGGFLSRPSSEERAANQSTADANRQLIDLAAQNAAITQPGLRGAVDFYSTILGIPTGPAPGTGGSMQPVYGPGGGVPQLSLVNPVNTPSSVASGAAQGFGTAAGVAPFTGPAAPFVLAGGAIAGGIRGFIGRGRREADALAPTQNYITGEATRINDEIWRMQQAGTLTQQDIADAQSYLNGLHNQFNEQSQAFGRAGPGGRESLAWISQLTNSWNDIPPESLASAGAATGEGGTATGGAATDPSQLSQSQRQRAGIQQVLAVPIQALTEQYDAVRQNILDTLPPGGVRDQALAQIEQSRSADIGRLFTQLPGEAAAALAAIGTNNAPTSVNALHASLLGSTRLAGLLGDQRTQTLNTGVGIGNLFANTLFGRQGQPRQTSQQQGSQPASGIDYSALMGQGSALLTPPRQQWQPGT